MAIIAIGGKMGSGKNTVCDIIQGLCATNNGPVFEQKAFAGKLKEIASLLTGIPVEMFEDQEFKQSFILGEEWGTVESNQLMSVRELLQKLGTEVMRDGLHTNVWVNALFADYRGPKMSEYNPSNWIITDMRFPNEMESVKEKGGITIRVTRNPIIVITLDGEKLTLDYNEWLKQKQFYENQGWQFTEHPSETALDDAKFDYEIINDGSMEDLIEKVRQILITEKII